MTDPTTCLVCRTETKDWSLAQKQDHGIEIVTVKWPVPNPEEHTYRVPVCRMCQIGLLEVYRDPFVKEHHQPVVDKLNKVIRAVQEAMK